MASQTFPAQADVGAMFRFTSDSTGLQNYVDFDGSTLTTAKEGDLAFREATQWRRLGFAGHFEALLKVIAATGGFSELITFISSHLPSSPGGGAQTQRFVRNAKTVTKASSITIKVTAGNHVLLRLATVNTTAEQQVRVRRSALDGTVVGGPVTVATGSGPTVGGIQATTVPVYIADDNPGSGDVTYHISGATGDTAVVLENIMAEELGQ